MIALSRASYVDKIIKKYTMQDVKKGSQPSMAGFTISLDDYPKTSKERERMKKIPYVSAIGSLMYVMLCTRLDICYAIGIIN